MTTPTRLPIRSSARNRYLSLEEVPPTDIQQNPLPNTRRGKRTRDSSPGSLSNASLKKLKSHEKDNRRPKRDLDDEYRKDLPLRVRNGTKDAVTPLGRSRRSEPPLKPQHQHAAVNGSTLPSQPAQTSPNIQKPINNTSDTTKHTAPPEKRSLRSQAGCSRSKSELALYFTNYDELVSIEPKEPEFLTPATLFYITDEPSKTTYKTSNASSTLTNGQKRRLLSSPQPPTLNGFSKSLQLTEEIFSTLNDAERIDLDPLDKSARHPKDPLTDAVFLKAHKRAERAEKQLRNIEKERAMHEKVQLERLLEGLKGHDWLRVMGISGITDGEKKQYEPKRDYFVKEVRVLLVKFQEWKEEEKRRKVEKEESMRDEDEGHSEDDEDGEQADDEDDDGGESDGDPPDYTSVDASARQLHREALLSTKSRAHSLPHKRVHRKKPPLDATGPPIEKPFTSFYSKPYLRDAAVGKHRRGRVRFAFGQPLPDPGEQEFELGEEILTPDAVRASERKRRVSKRAKEAGEGNR